MASLGTVPPTALAQTRIELHWLAQVVSAVGDAFLPAAPDDSQSNCAWDPEQAALLGRPIGAGARLALAVADAELRVLSPSGEIADRRAAEGRTLSELLSWAGETVGKVAGEAPASAPAVRDYDMPAHPAAGGGAFSLSDTAARGELAHWYAHATRVLEASRAIDSQASDVRCWPHHFDLGGIVMLEPDKPFEEARQIGFGWSPGDLSYEEPYYYVTPFPVPASLPPLESGGHWHEQGFTGAILTGTVVTSAADGTAQDELARRFVRCALEALLPLVSP